MEWERVQQFERTAEGYEAATRQGLAHHDPKALRQQYDRFLAQHAMPGVGVDDVRRETDAMERTIRQRKVRVKRGKR